MEQQLLAWVSHYGAVALFALLAFGIVGLPVPNETLLTLAGALIRKGELHLASTLLAACAGNIVGVTASYGLGRFAGMTSWVHNHLATSMINLEHWFEKIGKWTLAFGYFIPGVRHLTALAAGSSGFPFRTFVPFAYGGAVVWTLLFLGLGYYLGARLPSSFDDIHNKALLVCLIGALAVAGYEVYRRHFASFG